MKAAAPSDAEFRRLSALAAGLPFDPRPVEVRLHDFRFSPDGRHLVDRPCRRLGADGRPVYRVPAVCRRVTPAWFYRPSHCRPWDVA